MSRVREREVSTRLIRPTLSELNVKQVLEMVQNFDPEWEMNGKITVSCFGNYWIVKKFSNGHFPSRQIKIRPRNLTVFLHFRPAKKFSFLPRFQDD